MFNLSITCNRKGDKISIARLILAQLLQELEQEKLIKHYGGSASEKYVLADNYFAIKNTPSEIGGFRPLDIYTITKVLKTNATPKMSDFVDAFKDDMSRDQVRYLIDKLVDVVLDKKGSGKGAYYELKGEAIEISDILKEA